MEQPVFTPYVCKKCGVGVGGEGRIYFIDVGIDDDINEDYRDHGAIYFCNLCAHNFITEIITVIQNWNDEHASRSISSTDDAGDVEEPESSDSGSIVSDPGSEGIDDLAESTVDDDHPESATFSNNAGSDGNGRSGSLTF
jgi:hypothetical protein